MQSITLNYSIYSKRINKIRPVGLDKNIVSNKSVSLNTRGQTSSYLYLRSKNEQGKEGRRPPADVRQKAWGVINELSGRMWTLEMRRNTLHRRLGMGGRQS